MNSVERYYQKKKRRKKKAKVLFFTLFFILLMITLSILSMTVFFNADTILVEGNSHYSAEEILEAGGIKIGQNLFRLDKFEVIDQMEELPYVKEVTIRRKLPNTLKVSVVENQPVVWVECAGKAALLNEEYRILEFAELVPIKKEQAEEPEEEPSEEEEEEAPAEQLDDEEAAEEQSDEDRLTLAEKEEEPPTIADSKKPKWAKALPFLKGVACEGGEIGDFITFSEEQEDYTGFLKALYDGFAENEELKWDQVQRVDLNARFDVLVQYGETITIDFGTIEQMDTKLELAAYLLRDNGTSRKAVVDVSNTERVYFRPIHD